MGAFITALGGAFMGLVELLFMGLSKRAFAAAFIGSYIILIVAFALSINTLLTGISYVYEPSGFVAAGLSLCPSNAKDCIAAIGAAYLLRWTFIWKVKTMKTWMMP